MEPVAVAALLGLIPAFVLLWFTKGPALPLWTTGIVDGIEKLGLTRDVYGGTADGEVDGLLLHLSVHRGERHDVTLRVMAPLDSVLTLGPEVGGPDDPCAFEVGDPAFDRLVRVVAADPIRALAILDPATRDAVALAVGDGAQLTRKGWVRTWTVTVAEPWGPALARAGKTMVLAHKAMERAVPRRPIDGIVARLRTDRAPGVRRRALAILGERGLATRKLLEPSLGDLDPEIRLTVATRLEAWDVVMDLVRTGSRTWRVRAAEQLVAGPGRIPAGAVGELQDIVVGALADPELAAAGAEVLGRIGDPRVLPALAEAASSGPAAAREASRAAATAIRARHAHAEGGLTLVHSADSGALSVAQTPGRLRVAEREG